MEEIISKKIGTLKTNLSAIESLVELFEGMTDRRLINSREVEETKLKMKYAKEQIMELTLKNKKLLLSAEKREMP